MTTLKKIIILFLLIVSSATCFSQEKDSAVLFSKVDYLQKSNNQKTAAWLLTGGAAAVGIGALVHDMNSILTDATGSTGLYIASAALLATGITFLYFLAQTKTRQMAVAVFINIEDVQTLRYAVVRNHSLPSLRISVRF